MRCRQPRSIKLSWCGGLGRAKETKKNKKHAYVYFSSGYMIKHYKRWAEQTKIERNRNDEHDQTSTTILSANVMFKPIMKYNTGNTCLCHVFSIFFFSIFCFIRSYKKLCENEKPHRTSNDPNGCSGCEEDTDASIILINPKHRWFTITITQIGFWEFITERALVLS